MSTKRRVKADALLSNYVRRSNADDSGYAECITCGKHDNWKDMDCGHYITRAVLSTRYDLTNVAPQCRECNRLHNGRPNVFKNKLITKYGKDEVDALIRRSKEPPFEKASMIYDNAIQFYSWLIKEKNLCSELARKLSQ